MATSKEFLIEDDDAAYVSYLPQDAWESWIGSNYHADSYHVTKVPGAFVTLVFNGTYVAYYSDKNSDHAEFTVILDGESVFNGTSFAPSLAPTQLLFSSSVPQGAHNLTIRNAGDPGLMGVDYFVYHAQLSASSALNSTPVPAASTASKSPLPTSYPARTTAGTGAIVGSAALAGGALLLLLIGVAVLVARRRRGRDRRAPVEVDAAPPPYSESPGALTWQSLPRGKVERAAFQSE